MMNFINSLMDIITNLLGFLFSLLYSFVLFLMQIPKYMNFLFSFLGFIPSFLYPFAAAFICITILLFILGRKGSN